MTTINLTPFFKTILVNIISMEYSDIKETEWYKLIKSEMEYSNFSLVIDDKLYVFQDINELFQSSLRIYQDVSKKNYFFNIPKYSEQKEYACLLENAIYKMNSFITHADSADELADALSVL
jgi:hypothetical protein